MDAHVKVLCPLIIFIITRRDGVPRDASLPQFTCTAAEKSSTFKSEGQSLSHQGVPSVDLWRVIERV
jgi:hypothetical protein